MASMELMETIDLYCMEKFLTGIRDDQNSGTASRQSSSSSSSSLDNQRDCSPNGAKGAGREDGNRTSVVGFQDLVCLTLGLGGLQVVWTAIMSQGSPYLSSLGLPKYLISLVWLAGPISGAFVQPYIGTMSDRCQHPWGRRKPFIVFGTIATIVCMLALPWTADTNAFLFSSFSGNPDGRAAVIVRGFVAAAWIWALNVSIQPVQAGMRALIVDSCPSKQQARASAYASCVTGVGSIFGYASGFVPLPQLLPWLGNTQFKGLCVIASVALASSVAITCSAVDERRALSQSNKPREQGGIFFVFRRIFTRLRTMPKAIQKVCVVQFFAWMGWFPFLFYITTYIGELYRAERTNKHTPFQSPLSLEQSSIRYGTLSMILFATTALLTNLLLPLFTSSRPSTPTIPPETLQFDDETPSPDFTEEQNEQRPFLPPATPPHVQPRSCPAIPSLTLPRAWTLSHLLASTLLFSTALTRNRIPSTILVALLGIPWALTQWAPFALISAEIARSPLAPPTTTQPDNDYNNDEDEDEDESGRVEQLAGTIMGLHNMAIAVPQIVAAVGSSALFWGLGRWGVQGGEAVGWVVRGGGVAMGVAGFVCHAGF